MADVLRIKRRVSGAPGAPSGLANAELAYNEVDHILYYGEGTGGAGGTASVIPGIGGQGMSSVTLPTMNGAGAAGVATTWSRGDHVHPTDTTRAPLASPVFTGTPQLPTGTIAVTQTAGNSTTAIATTAFVSAAVAAGTGVVSFNTRTGAVTLLLSDVTTVGGAPINAPTFTGIASAVTPANGTNTTQLATTQYVMATRLDQFVPPNFDVSWNTHKITNLLDPVAGQDAATKSYVDTIAQGLDTKASVRAATTANLAALSGPQTIDGISLIAGDRVLVKDQTTQANNGIYVVQAAAWTRALDADTWNELVSAYTFVESGTVNADNGFTCTVDPGGTLGTTAVTWTQFNGTGQITAGAGLTKTGNTLDVIGTTNRILVNADNVDIAATYVGQTSITTLGTVTTGVWNGTTLAVANGGSGASTLTGYLKGNGASAFTGSATIPNTDIAGLGTMSTQNATAVAITGGTIDGVTFDMGTF
jgi:hypothetical protein